MHKNVERGIRGKEGKNNANKIKTFLIVLQTVEVLIQIKDQDC